MPGEFKSSALNGAFTVELEEFFVNSPIEYWIYGHSHRNINKTIGETKCLSNQLGYVFQGEHDSFSHNSFIEMWIINNEKYVSNIIIRLMLVSSLAI